MSPLAIIIPSLYYSALQFGDYKSSKDAINRGGIEANENVNFLGLPASKIIGTIAMTGGDILLQKSKNKKLLWSYRILSGGVYSYVIYRNSKILNK